MSISFTSETFFTEVHISNVKWDDLLPPEFVSKYNNFIEEFRKLSFISVPCYLFIDQHNIVRVARFL